MSKILKVGDCVITPYKNRLNIKCCGIVQNVHEDSADILVWNFNGPGADKMVLHIPLEELFLYE